MSSRRNTRLSNKLQQRIETESVNAGSTLISIACERETTFFSLGFHLRFEILTAMVVWTARRVDLQIHTNVLEEHIASIFRDGILLWM